MSVGSGQGLLTSLSHAALLQEAGLEPRLLALRSGAFFFTQLSPGRLTGVPSECPSHHASQDIYAISVLSAPVVGLAGCQAGEALVFWRSNSGKGGRGGKSVGSPEGSGQQKAGQRTELLRLVPNCPQKSQTGEMSPSDITRVCRVSAFHLATLVALLSSTVHHFVKGLAKRKKKSNTVSEERKQQQLRRHTD